MRTAHATVEDACFVCGVPPSTSDAHACEVHNPSYDFNDAAAPYGASFFARLVEKRLR
jgi:metal-dependent amidase/aminoacylase/carboxypeptidase family protein